jgi:hypothetical protein
VTSDVNSRRATGCLTALAHFVAGLKGLDKRWGVHITSPITAGAGWGETVFIDSAASGWRVMRSEQRSPCNHFNEAASIRSCGLIPARATLGNREVETYVQGLTDLCMTTRLAASSASLMLLLEPSGAPKKNGTSMVDSGSE